MQNLEIIACKLVELWLFWFSSKNLENHKQTDGQIDGGSNAPSDHMGLQLVARRTEIDIDLNSSAFKNLYIKQKM